MKLKKKHSEICYAIIDGYNLLYIDFYAFRLEKDLLALKKVNPKTKYKIIKVKVSEL